jgi:hypothetical protein
MAVKISGKPYDFYHLVEQLEAVHSLRDLKEAFREIVPQFFFQGIEGETELHLPFPPDVVKGITEKDIYVLQELFDIPDNEQYSIWGYNYLEINLLFRSTKSRTKQAKMLLDQLQKEKLPMAVSTFLIGGAFISWWNRSSTLSSVKELKKSFPKFEKEVAKVREAIDVLLEFVQQIDSDFYLPLKLDPENLIKKWPKKAQFENLLRQLQHKIEQGFGENISNIVQEYIDHQFTPSQYTSDGQKYKPITVYLAHEEMTKLAKNTDIFDPIGVAKRLFELVGIEIELETAGRQLRRYRKADS